MSQGTSVLFVASNPLGTKLDFAKELDLIERAGRFTGAYTVIPRWSVGLKDLERLTKDFAADAVHILSPGAERERQLLYLGNNSEVPELVSPHELAAVFRRLRKPPKLVLLNFCYSGPHAEAISPFVGCSMAMRGPVSDEAAITFADMLYRSAASGTTLHKAFDSARKAMRKHHPGDMGDPCLYAGRFDPAGLRLAASAPKPRRAPSGSGGRAIRIFCSYSHKDEKYRRELETSLASLRMQTVHVWHDRLIKPGTDWAKDINDNLDHADVVLLLVSPDFLDSQYCMGIELQRALRRQESDGLRVVPILVRQCELTGIPFTKLQWLPTGDKPVKKWIDRDSAWVNVAKGIRSTVEELTAAK